MTEMLGQLRDVGPAAERLRRDVLAGLARTPKSIPSIHRFDERGWRIHDLRVTVDDWYPASAELEIMDAYAADIARRIGPRVVLVEYGCGRGVKARCLLDRLRDPAVFVPIDRSPDHLLRTAAALAVEYPRLRVLPVPAEFSDRFELPVSQDEGRRRVVYYPASAIGDFEPAEAVGMLRGTAALVGRGGGLLVAVDLKKDRESLLRAYDDRHGFGRALEMNLLARINRELGADLRLEAFEARAVWNWALGRVETHLASLEDQSVEIAGRTIRFARGETIRTSIAQKYGLAEFRRLAARAGFAVEKVWLDAQRLYSVQWLVAREIEG